MKRNSTMLLWIAELGQVWTPVVTRRGQVWYLCCMCCGGSISTKVGLFLAASLPPALSSGKPGRLRSLERRSSVRTLQMSLCLTTSQASLPSQSSTLETGSAVRSLAYSTGGSAAVRRAKGNLGGAERAVSCYACWKSRCIPHTLLLTCSWDKVSRCRKLKFLRNSGVTQALRKLAETL